MQSAVYAENSRELDGSAIFGECLEFIGPAGRKDGGRGADLTGRSHPAPAAGAGPRAGDARALRPQCTVRQSGGLCSARRGDRDPKERREKDPDGAVDMMGRAGEGRLIALAGNPNVGKSTLFNALTGQRQHTGNWPGKTVSLAQGAFSYKAEEYALVDLPGTYSLQGCSREEEIATEFLAREDLCCTLAVCDATNLERSLLLALEVMERTERVMLCVNLMDEAAAAGVTVDLRRLEAELGVPVIGIAAARKQGLDAMQERLRAVCDGFERPHPRRLGLTEARTPREAERNVRRLVERAEEIAERCVETGTVQARTQRLDRVLTGKITGPLLMVMLLFGVLWLTISGANPISGWLEGCFGALQAWVRGVWRDAGWLEWLGGLLLDGVFGTTAKVVAVMLPPVAIFFPLFSILEEVGYLPRIAYLLDEQMARTGGCGRQVLTMCMGKNRMPKSKQQ